MRGKEASVSFNSFLKRGNKMIALGRSDYRIKKVPDSVITLGLSNNGFGKSCLHNTKYINVTLFNFGFDIKFLVTQCDIEIYEKAMRHNAFS